MDEVNKKLPILHIIKMTYKSIFNNMKSFLILSYLIMAPLYAVRFSLPSQLGFQSAALWLYFVFILVVMLFLSIFLYRVFILAPADHFKLNANELIKVFLKTLLYAIALIAVISLTIITVSLLFGLMLSIINSAAENNAIDISYIESLIYLVILGFVMIAILRTQPTFISIAITARTIPMKSAYYYTRDNNWNMLAIGVINYLPMMMVAQMLTFFTGYINGYFELVILFILSPINLMPYALILSTGAQIYKYLIAAQQNENDVVI